ncbi:MAG TPA: spore coat U domain-containing protein [Gammaproteobacteria bacterium]|nr:spore coat U domain-containing protein [Gammaproteobacteria bacterium]
MPVAKSEKRSPVRGGAAMLALLCICWAGVATAACTVSTSGISFGTYNPLASTAATTTGSVTVSCSLLTSLLSYQIALGPGSGTVSQRTMHAGASTLDYNVYTDATYSTIWGNTSTGLIGLITGTLSSVLGSQSHTVYGRIPAGQNVPPGSYSDSLTVTVTY